MGLGEGEFPLTTALLSKPEMKINTVYTWTGDTAEASVDISRSVHEPPSIYKKNNEKIMTTP